MGPVVWQAVVKRLTACENTEKRASNVRVTEKPGAFLHSVTPSRSNAAVSQPVSPSPRAASGSWPSALSSYDTGARLDGDHMLGDIILYRRGRRVRRLLRLGPGRATNVPVLHFERPLAP
jgi:hypothetical protein